MEVKNMYLYIVQIFKMTFSQRLQRVMWLSMSSTAHFLMNSIQLLFQINNTTTFKKKQKSYGGVAGKPIRPVNSLPLRTEETKYLT